MDENELEQEEREIEAWIEENRRKGFERAYQKAIDNPGKSFTIRRGPVSIQFRVRKR